MMLLSAMAFLPLWRIKEGRLQGGIYFRDLFKLKSTLSALSVSSLIVVAFILHLASPLVWYAGLHLAKWLYEKSFRLEFGSEWMATIWRDQAFRILLNGSSFCLWSVIVLMWSIEDKGESLALGWGLCLVSAVLSSLCTWLNCYRGWAPKDQEDSLVEDEQQPLKQDELEDNEEPSRSWWWSSRPEAEPEPTTTEQESSERTDTGQATNGGWWW